MSSITIMFGLLLFSFLQLSFGMNIPVKLALNGLKTKTISSEILYPIELKTRKMKRITRFKRSHDNSTERPRGNHPLCETMLGCEEEIRWWCDQALERHNHRYMALLG